MNEKAKWIWGAGEPSPRNEWRCFRRTVDVPAAGWDEAKLSITADSRYVAYINGIRVGRGPARSYPFEQETDVHDIGHLLLPGKRNTIAVLVLHFGVSTFYYLRGRGGLLASLELLEQSRGIEWACVTDRNWTTAKHLGQDSRAPRMSSQNAFAERYDARLWDERWAEADFDDSGWEAATEIGEIGMLPWEKLKERDIPFLTEQAVHPVRVEQLYKVKPVPYAIHLDMRNQMVPGSEDHMNTVVYVGYAATVVEAITDCRAVVGFTNNNVFGPISVNGEWIPTADFYGELPERYVEVELKKGPNWLMIDVTGADLAVGMYMGLHSDAQVTVRSPLGESGDDSSEWITIGPFEWTSNTTRPVDQTPSPTHPAYREAAGIRSTQDLDRFAEWVRPVPKRLVDPDNVFTRCVWKPVCEPVAIPRQLQNAAIAHPTPGVVPLFEDADTEFTIDFGRIVSGFLRFEIEAESGTVVDMYGFEHLRDGWRQETYKMNNTLEYICRGGRQTFESQVRRGLRYVMITIRRARSGGWLLQHPVKLYGVQVVQSLFPVADIGSFQCSDTVLTDIWNISRHTVRLCMEDTFVDCPTYEQTYWVGDSRNEALVAYYVFGAEDVTRHSLALVPGSGRQTPFYSCQLPSGWSSVIPNWTFFWIIACLEYYEQTGDEPFLAEIWPAIRSTLDAYLGEVNEDGLFAFRGWNLLEWAAMDTPGDGVVTHQNMFLVQALRTAGRIAVLVGEQAERERLEAAADRLAAAINAHLWCEEHGAYRDSIHADGSLSLVFSMQTQVVAELCAIPHAVSGRAERIAAHLTNPPPSFVQIGSAFMSFFYYEALARHGRVSEIVDDIRVNYKRMLDEDASACWEMFPNSTNRQNDKFLTRSHAHAWSAAPGFFLGAYVLGVRRADVAWKKAVVEPHPCGGLTWCRGTVPLPGDGRIDVVWELDSAVPGTEATMRLRVWAPSDVELDIRIPDGYNGLVETYRLDAASDRV
ncbi:family 78 glycoside hydrolase catalytic domain [Paenibacillus sp. HJGM_3]|uniref:family 78 glycoside hydrolase catalytic domain n=1 Tax=Paenibacillus sp. HJGM_3 TaxID=3379816 RepID=UPI0038594150